LEKEKTLKKEKKRILGVGLWTWGFTWIRGGEIWAHSNKMRNIQRNEKRKRIHFSEADMPISGT